MGVSCLEMILGGTHFSEDCSKLYRISGKSTVTVYVDVVGSRWVILA